MIIRYVNTRRGEKDVADDIRQHAREVEIDVLTATSRYRARAMPMQMTLMTGTFSESLRGVSLMRQGMTTAVAYAVATEERAVNAPRHPSGAALVAVLTLPPASASVSERVAATTRIETMMVASAPRRSMIVLSRKDRRTTNGRPAMTPKKIVYVIRLCDFGKE